MPPLPVLFGLALVILAHAAGLENCLAYYKINIPKSLAFYVTVRKYNFKKEKRLHSLQHQNPQSNLKHS